MSAATKNLENTWPGTGQSTSLSNFNTWSKGLGPANKKIMAELKERGEILYVVDHRDNQRQIF